MAKMRAQRLAWGKALRLRRARYTRDRRIRWARWRALKNNARNAYRRRLIQW